MAASVADADAVDPNAIKMLLANAINTFPIKGNPVFSNGSKGLPKNYPDWLISCNWIFDNFTLAARIFENCELVTNNLRGTLFSSLELTKTFDESFKVTSVPFFIPNINLLKCYIESFSIKAKIKIKILL